MTGAAAGMAAAGGRWLIEECEASSVNGMMTLRLGGLGWKWVDQEPYENIVRQYVYFSATVDMEGSLQLGYDAMTHVASVSMLPKTEASVKERCSSVPSAPMRRTSARRTGVSTGFGKKSFRALSIDDV